MGSEIAEYFPQGPNSEHHKRSLIDGVLYLVNNGCKWRAPSYQYNIFHKTDAAAEWSMVCELYDGALEGISGTIDTV